jgi:curli biogenesis system outer membrane secretion channel CsgG
MNKGFVLALCFFCAACALPVGIFAADPETTVPTEVQETQPLKIALFITEQNIEGPRSAWWASEVDLSATEAALATKLLAAGFTVVQPLALQDVIRKEKAYRTVDIGDRDTAKIASLGDADLAITGKAVASAGGNVPQSSMRSCFANVTVRIVDAKTGKILAYIDASGNSAHMDVISGGREALIMAADNIAPKIIDAVSKHRPQQAANPAEGQAEQKK